MFSSSQCERYAEEKYSLDRSSIPRAPNLYTSRNTEWADLTPTPTHARTHTHLRLHLHAHTHARTPPYCVHFHDISMCCTQRKVCSLGAEYQYRGIVRISSHVSREIAHCENKQAQLFMFREIILTLRGGMALVLFVFLPVFKQGCFRSEIYRTCVRSYCSNKPFSL